MREDGFREWLDRRGIAPKAARTRIYAVRTIEKNLDALGFSYADLGEAWQADEFESLRQRLKALRDDFKSGGHDFQILMRESEKPVGRLTSWSSWLAQYGRFLAGDPPGRLKDADRIRQYVLDDIITPARLRGEREAEVRVSEVNSALGLNEAWPNICQALAGRKFQDIAQIPEPERLGKDQSSATVFRFNLAADVIDRAALEKMRRAFLAESPDFKSFTNPGEGWARGEKAYKLAAMDRVQAVLAEAPDDEDLGKQVFEIMKTAGKDSPFVRWQTEDSVAKAGPDQLGEFHRIIGQLVRSQEDAGDSLQMAFEALGGLETKGGRHITQGERVNILFSALAMVRPMEAAPVKVTRFDWAWRFLTGNKLFSGGLRNMATDYQRFRSVFAQLFEIMRDDWGWDPQDWLDIQGFLWIASHQHFSAGLKPEDALSLEQARENDMTTRPENLILYGPPGTGKTYATAAEALRLCGVDVPDDREAVMEAYQELVKAGRIEFVTFHQSMSYEDFVEGRRPETGSSEGEETNASGFRLETKPGIFRRIARRAESSRGRRLGADAITLEGRRVFKMSIGEASNPDNAHLFEEAIDEGCTILGYADIDWTDEKYADRHEIMKAVKEQAPEFEANNNSSGAVRMPATFRNEMAEGDLIVVSKGNHYFRAIGEITGDYQFRPREEGGYAHRRPVNWLWVDREGVPATEIHDTNFTQSTIHSLKAGRLNTAALERYINSQREDGVSSEPEPFVLIIDEINRANISKVFGELITLLEADKRLGQPNALRVRLPYSEQPFGVPSNLHIIGTMNTADRSIALLDTALRRRFTFREMMPDPSILDEAAEACGRNLPVILETLNARIEYLYDREHQIGHAYFTGCRSRAEVDGVMRHKVIPLLAEYFFEDWSKIAAVLGDLEPGENEIRGGFLNRIILHPPPGFEDVDASPQFRWSIRPEAEGFDYSGLDDS
ncbi:AAA family ATPase [Hyphobacterium indicum]|uniref:AAA family ATPase n=1 Tax=Hyphobacterium indicum TaxID=2162714 RepID=UPI001F43FFD1|nr:AAA family ATPase [Hyphobacterium indicum]